MSNKPALKEGERLDDLNIKNYFLIQNPRLFCFGMDAVLLSSFTEVKEGEEVIDLGTGNGIIPILLEAKTKGKSFLGLEIQAESVDMARRSVLYNDLSHKIRIDQGDIKKVEEYYKKESFDVVTSNPPYMNEGGGLKNPYEAKAIARHELLCKLEDVIAATAYLLKNKGRFYLIHRPYRLVDIIFLLRKYRLEPKKMQLVQPYEGKEPNMVLIEAIKNAGTLLKVLPPLIIYDNQGQYTKEVKRLYYEDDII
ncbi:MAG: tRNA1(Val) (adenine(37)-N6)-methyltransferase [Epulopiscium sp.]|nr:tRNA1(Val) (adenine(37)-N6)-methyltransferase [Candidatus Epulonipiscium sp.]